MYVGLNEFYKCTKLERNRNMGKLLLCNLNVFVILCEGEEKCEENQAIYRNKYVTQFAKTRHNSACINFQYKVIVKLRAKNVFHKNTCSVFIGP